LRPLALACLLAWQAPALAADWTGGTGDWFVPGNWAAGVPAAGVDALIANGGTAQVQAPGAVAQTTFVWFGSTLEVSGTGTLTAAQIGVDNTSRLNVTGGGQLTLTSNLFQVFRDANALVDGAGSSVTSGVVSVGGNGGSTGPVLTVSNGGKVVAANRIQTGNSPVATLNVGSGAGAGILDTQLVTAGNAPLVLNLNHNETNYYLTRNGTGSGAGISLSGAISITVNSGGSTTLVGPATYTGATTLTNGTLRAGANGAFSGSSAYGVNGTSTLDVNGTTQTIASLTGSSGATVALGSGSLTVGDAGNTAYAGAITGSGGRLNKTGTGTLTLSGAGSYTGATNVNQGTLATGGSGTLATGSAFTVASGATLDISGGTANQTMGSLAGAGSVSLGARSLTAGGDNSSTVYSGALSGGLNNTGLVKNGSGTLSITGNNVGYSSDTTINSGTLRVGNANALGTAAGGGAVTLNNANLASDVNATWNRDFSFAAGTTGTVAAASGTTFSLSLVNLNGDAVFGSGSDNGIVEIGNSAFTNAGASLRVGAGTLRAQGGTGGLSTLTSTIASTTVDAGTTLDYSGAAGNSGTIKNLQGAGDVKNDGGTTTVQAGGFSGRITGSTNLSKSTSGTLILSGANDYNGTTSIAAGTVQVGNGGTTGQLGTGAISNTATLAFSRGDNISVANTLTGNGTLNKLGAGKLLYTGTGSGYTGTTNVNAGTLSVNGSLGGTLNVNSGGTLGGNGTVGTLNVLSGGVLAPGNSIGTLTVTGNVTFNTGSIYRVETDAAGNADRVNATGQVIVNGGTVDVQAGGGTYARNTAYTILNGATGRTGTFAGVTSNLAFLTPTLLYDANNVYLNLQSGNAASYGSVAGTANQYGVANYLNGFANNPGNAQAAALIQGIDNLSASQARNAFDSLTGSQHASGSQVVLALSRGFGDALLGRAGSGAAGGGFGGAASLRGSAFGMGSPSMPWSGNADAPAQLAALFAGGAGGNAAGAASTLNGVAMGGSAAGNEARETGVAASGDGFGPRRANWGANASGQNGLWGQALGGGGRIASDGNGAGSSYRAGGFVAGYDRALSDKWLLGVAGGYNRASWDASTNGIAPAGGKVQTPRGAVYARYTGGPWMVAFSGTYADHKFDTSRTVTIGTSSSVATSSHRGAEWGFGAQAEYALAAGAWQLRPLAGLRYSHLREEAFTESGAAGANLSIDARGTQSTTLSGGVRLLRAFNAGSAADGGFELRAIASHLFGDNDAPVSARLAGQAASFTATGTPLKRDALTFGAGVSAKLGRGFTGYADASYEMRGGGQEAYAIAAGVKYLW
jgi:outer membrane autotransporter protein